MIKMMLVYICLITVSLVMVLIRRKKNKDFLCEAAGHYVIFYYLVCLVRTMVGNGGSFLSTSFADKEIAAYIKVVVLCLCIAGGLYLVERIFKNRLQSPVNYTVGSFAALYIIYSCLIDFPKMGIVVILGAIGIVAGGALFIVEKYMAAGKSQFFAGNKKENYLILGSSILLFISMFLLTGPTELYVYNTSDFVFQYNEFIVYMIMYVLLMGIFFLPAIVNYLPDIVVRSISIVIFIYCICSYIQQLFLNGSMGRMEGNRQAWEKSLVVSNLVIWVVIALILVALAWITGKNRKVLSYIALFLSGVQLLTFVTLLLTSGVFTKSTEQLVEDRKFVMASNENLTIFILDAYDVQMLNMVLDTDENYLEPLKDFTYYDRMTSRYSATDGSLPYLLTGRIAEEEMGYNDIYQKSDFLPGIKDEGYEINILTEAGYVQPFEKGVVDNLTGDYYCVLDCDKAVSQMSKCVRYRCAPYLLKSQYYYENYYLTNIIDDTNVYLFGMDADFYSDLKTEGLTIDESIGGMMHIYHLYGAHSPYYLAEDASLNYNSNPVAQWKGCLRIVYDYLDELRENGLYDSASVIIMADHGLNRSQRSAMDEWNIDVTGDSNPIFFIKHAGEKHDKLVVDDSTITHDDFFGIVEEIVR